MKRWLTGKDPDTEKDRRQKEKGTTEDEMVGWHHQLNGPWVWASSERWWRTGKPGVPQSMGLQRVSHNWVTEQWRHLCNYKDDILQTTIMNRILDNRTVLEHRGFIDSFLEQWEFRTPDFSHLGQGTTVSFHKDRGQQLLEARVVWWDWLHSGSPNCATLVRGFFWAENNQSPKRFRKSLLTSPLLTKRIKVGGLS